MLVAHLAHISQACSQSTVGLASWRESAQAKFGASSSLLALGLAPTNTSLAGFETALKGKMNILTGYVSALANTEISGTLNDVYTLSAKNHLADPGVSVIGLGH